MGKTTKMLILIFLLIFIAILLYSRLNLGPNQTSSQNLPTVSINLNNQPYLLEIAKSNSERSRGLSNRNSLCGSCGMIFVFDNLSILPFWMKDTLIPLDMIWLTYEGNIVSIQTAQPQPNSSITQLVLYKNTTPAQYVIELNAGDSAKLNLKTGDKIDLSLLNINN